VADRSTILSTADHLISKDRADVYGPPRQSFGRIGALWGAMLGTDAIAPETVALMLVQLKVSRIISSPDHEDSWVDLCGYGALGAELATAGEPAADVVPSPDRSPSDTMRRWAGVVVGSGERVEFDALPSDITIVTETKLGGHVEAHGADGVDRELRFLAEVPRG